MEKLAALTVAEKTQKDYTYSRGLQLREEIVLQALAGMTSLVYPSAGPVELIEKAELTGQWSLVAYFSVAQRTHEIPQEVAERYRHAFLKTHQLHVHRPVEKFYETLERPLESLRVGAAMPPYPDHFYSPLWQGFHEPHFRVLAAITREGMAILEELTSLSTHYRWLLKRDSQFALNAGINDRLLECILRFSETDYPGLRYDIETNGYFNWFHFEQSIVYFTRHLQDYAYLILKLFVAESSFVLSDVFSP